MDLNRYDQYLQEQAEALARRVSTGRKQGRQVPVVPSCAYCARIVLDGGLCAKHADVDRSLVAAALGHPVARLVRMATREIAHRANVILHQQQKGAGDLGRCVTSISKTK